MADAAGVHLDADLSRAGLGDIYVGYFELFIRRWNAGDLHGGHVGEITPEAAMRAFAADLRAT